MVVKEVKQRPEFAEVGGTHMLSLEMRATRAEAVRLLSENGLRLMHPSEILTHLVGNPELIRLWERKSMWTAGAGFKRGGYYNVGHDGELTKTTEESWNRSEKLYAIPGDKPLLMEVCTGPMAEHSPFTIMACMRPTAKASLIVGTRIDAMGRIVRSAINGIGEFYEMIELKERISAYASRDIAEAMGGRLISLAELVSNQDLMSMVENRMFQLSDAGTCRSGYNRMAKGPDGTHFVKAEEEEFYKGLQFNERAYFYDGPEQLSVFVFSEPGHRRRLSVFGNDDGVSSSTIVIAKREGADASAPGLMASLRK